MKVLIFGSTGMVGEEVLQECLKHPKIKEITVVTRKPSISIDGVKEIVHTDFLDFSKIRDEIIDHDICFFCIGVYQGEVSKEKFIEITHTSLIALAKSIESNKTIFCLFSAQGANSKGLLLFAKWKGRAEEDLMKLNFKDAYAFRASYIHPSNASKLKEGLMYKVYEWFYMFAKDRFLQICISSNQLAKAMLHVALHGSDKKILDNENMRKII
jgi:uncharacterized protein YbjT (DUF2867 family)